LRTTEKFFILYIIHMTSILYFREASKRDQQTATILYMNKEYHWALFFWHLTLEKLLKALILKYGGEILYTHNLVRLAHAANLTLTENQERELTEITTFNLEARYDDEKLTFYKKATREYADHWIKICTVYSEQWETSHE